jgi:hypothetical protein
MARSSDYSGILLKKDTAESAGPDEIGALPEKLKVSLYQFLFFNFYHYNCMCLLASRPVRAKISSANSQ